MTIENINESLNTSLKKYNTTQHHKTKTTRINERKGLYRILFFFSFMRFPFPLLAALCENLHAAPREHFPFAKSKQGFIWTFPFPLFPLRPCPFAFATLGPPAFLAATLGSREATMAASVAGVTSGRTDTGRSSIDRPCKRRARCQSSAERSSTKATPLNVRRPPSTLFITIRIDCTSQS